MKFIVAKKIEMTQIFAEDGTVIPATILEASPVVVTQIKTKEKDGYAAVQVGYGSKKAKNVAKAQQGHVKELGSFAGFKEFSPEKSEAKVGDKIDASVFAVGDVVSTVSISKGKGFQGVVKRHGFGGGPRSHGQKHSEREPGSIGGGLRNKVPKGMRMAGRTGGDRITVKNLKVVQTVPESNLILVSGAIPGRKGTFVEIRG